MNPPTAHNTWADHYTRQAKKDNYPARSVFKLQEIQKKNQLIKKGYRVLDLGCAPGSWLLYAAELTGDRGSVVGVDLTPITIKLPPHVKTVVGDVLSLDNDLLQAIGTNFNVVISDMAPSTTGNKDTDAARSLYLCEAALAIAQKVLLPGGSFVCKIFQGQDVKSFSDLVRSAFNRHKLFKPQSCRKASREIYIIGLGKL